MFYNCRNLTEAPELPATTLATSAYTVMFYNCNKLIEAPELPATTLSKGCYWGMFRNCTSLQRIKMLATDISADSCLSGWVDNVAASGTFIKSIELTTITTGVNGIPKG